MVHFHHIVYMENSNPIRLGTDDTLFGKVIVQNIMTLDDAGVLWLSGEGKFLLVLKGYCGLPVW